MMGMFLGGALLIGAILFILAWRRDILIQRRREEALRRLEGPPWDEQA